MASLFAAAESIILGSEKEFSELQGRENPTRGSYLSRHPSSSSVAHFPVNPESQLTTTNCDSFNDRTQIGNARQNQKFKSPEINQFESASRSTWNTNSRNNVDKQKDCEPLVSETESKERNTSRKNPVPVTTFKNLFHRGVTKVRNWIEDNVIKNWFSKNTTTNEIKSNQTNTCNPTTVLESATAGVVEQPEIIPRPKNKKFDLKIKINGQPVIMTIDSGCHISIIGKLIWKQLGQPKLEPVIETWSAVTGSEIQFEGKFMADVNYAGKSLQLPLHVMDQSKTVNLLGRVWFPSLHLDWNRIFNCYDASRYQPNSDHQRQLALKTIQCRATDHFYIYINIEGKTIPMMLDTGASVSVISQTTWEMIGKPRLIPVQIPVVDAAQKRIPFKGVCMVKVKYDGREGVLPLIVRAAGNCQSIVGTNWFETLNFNFNTIFDNIEFPFEAMM